MSISIKDLRCGALYRGTRHVKVGRFRIRRLDQLIHHLGRACFTEMSDPINKIDHPKGTVNWVTIKSFAEWCVAELDGDEQ